MPLFKRLGMGTRLSAISLHFSYGIEYMALRNIYSYSEGVILREIFIIYFVYKVHYEFYNGFLFINVS
jgi:hypothetical protein